MATYDLTDYLEQQKKAGERWNEQKEALAKEHAEKLEQAKSPASASFKEQGALYNQLNNEQKKDPSVQLNRSQVDAQLVRQEETWKKLTARYEETKEISKILNAKSIELGVRSMTEFDGKTGEYLRNEASALKPVANAAKERIIESVLQDTRRNFEMGNTHGAASSYQDQAKSALNRDEQFQRRMETLQTSIERENDPLKKELMGAKRDFEFNEYKSAQTQRISHLTNDPKMLERSNRHDEKMEEAAIKAKDLEIKIQFRDKQPVSEQAVKDVSLVKNFQYVQSVADKRTELDREQNLTHQAIKSNDKRKALYETALNNPKFMEVQKRLAAMTLQKEKAVEQIEEHKQKELNQQKTY